MYSAARRRHVSVSGLAETVEKLPSVLLRELSFEGTYSFRTVITMGTIESYKDYLLRVLQLYLEKYLDAGELFRTGGTIAPVRILRLQLMAGYRAVSSIELSQSGDRFPSMT